MARKATTSSAIAPAHTPGRWLTEPVSPGTTLIVLEDGSRIATVGDGVHEGNPEESRANARFIAAAPDGYDLAVCMRNACEEHVFALTEEMVCGRPGASEGELDDLQAEINNWSMLLRRCDAYFAKADGKD